MDRKIKIKEGQDREKIEKNHVKVSVNRMQPVEETFTINEVKAQIEIEKKEITNLQAEITSRTNKINEWNELLTDIEKTLTA